MRRVVVWLVVVLVLLPLPARALDMPQAEEAIQSARDYGVEPEGGLEAGLTRLLDQVREQLWQVARGALVSGWKLLAVVLLCGVAQSVQATGESDGLGAVELAGALAITALTLRDMAGMIGLGRETLGKMDAFAGVLLPALATLTAATGGISGAALRQGVTVLWCDLLVSAMDTLLIPLVYAYVAACCAHAALGNQGLKQVAGLLKSALVGVLTTGLLVFVGYLTASGAIAGSADAAAIKAAKITISRAVPVVGSILADSAEVVLAGAGVLRGTVGVAGMLVVLTLCITPFLQLGLHYLMYKVAAALTATVASPRLSGLMEQIGGAFGLVLGMVGSGALVLLFSIVSALGAVVGA